MRGWRRKEIEREINRGREGGRERGRGRGGGEEGGRGGRGKGGREGGWPRRRTVQGLSIVNPRIMQLDIHDTLVYTTGLCTQIFNIPNILQLIRYTHDWLTSA